METKNLDFIKRSVVSQIAEKAKCTPGYVRHILSGKRNSNSRKAKAILAVAKTINDSLAKAQKSVNAQLRTLTEND